MTREEAIEWLIQIKDKYIHDGDEQFDTKRKEALGMAIEALRVDIVHCKECKFWSKNAKDWVQVYEPCCHFEPYDFCSYGERIEADGMAIEALKSDRPEGEWLCSDDSYENAVCSNCGFDSGESYVVVKYEQKWKACPMCEARMKGEDSECL